MSGAPARREDILASIGFGHVPATDTAFAALEDAAGQVRARFRFHEIVLVADAERQDLYLPLVDRVPNLRLFTVARGIDPYQKRVIAAEESIGDVVLLTDPAETAALDIVEMIERAAAQGRSVIGLRRGGPDMVRGAVASPLIALGRAAGFKVGAREMKTIAFPRTLLNQILSHSDPGLALRFPPRDPRLPLGYAVADGRRLSSRGGDAFQRLVLIQRLLMSMAGRVLAVVGLAAALLALSGIAFLLYILGVLAFASDPLQEGWLTISVMLSVTASFLGVSIFGISLGLQKLLLAERDISIDSVTHEVNRVDLFGQVASDLNVDVDRDEAPGSDPGAGRAALAPGAG